MDNLESQNILIKFLNNSANKAELNKLNTWVQDSENEALFKSYIQTHYAITLGMDTPDSSEIKKALLKEIRKEKNFFYKQRYTQLLKYAAVAVIFLGIGYTFQIALSGAADTEVLIPKEEAIVIDLGNNRKQVISPDGKLQILDANGKVIGQQEGSQLVYSDDVDITELTYNTITIPYGKKFEIKLSDGTLVYLNSGTSLKYPVKFIKGQNRKVFLNGEAYFDVSEDKSNPFVVNAQELDVQVFGTEFNVIAYPEDYETDVVLVEGSVGLSEKGNESVDKPKTLLRPGFKGSFNRVQKKISTSKVNTTLYTSWMKGNIVFRNESFNNIVKRLERHYNITIINNNKALANETFNATIETKIETIEDVLSFFNKVYEIQYQIVNNKIIIN